MPKKQVVDPRLILIYFEIAALSKAPCVLYASGTNQTYEVILSKLDEDTFKLASKSFIPSTSGILVLRAYTLQFKAEIKLTKGSALREYLVHLPEALQSHDPRRCVRIPVAPQLTKIVVVKKLTQEGVAREEEGKQKHQAVIIDVSASGLAFKLSEADPFFVENALIHITFNIFGITIDGTARVIGSSGALVRSHFEHVDRQIQNELHRKISENLEKLIERHHRELKNLNEASSHLRQLQEEKSKTGELQTKKVFSEDFIDLINPILESAVNVLEHFAGVTLQKREIRLERILSAVYDISAELTFSGPKINGNLFLCLREEVVLKIGEKMLGRACPAIDADIKDMVGELCNIIVGNSKKTLASERHFRLSTPTVIEGKEHLLAVLSSYPVIRMMFDSELGPIDLNLYLDEIRDRFPAEAVKKSFKFEYKPELIQPILNSTESIMENYLFLETRKKGVTMRDKLAPKFELSAMLDLFGSGVRGKIMLNLSDKLAIRINRVLTGDEKESVDEDVKDAVGEMVNIIAGNAKGEFSKMNLLYQLSTPFVIHGRNQIITSAGNNPFISTVYWTNEGFFEICLSFVAEV